MTKLTESTIEEFALRQLEQLGYESIHAPTIAPDGERPERESYEEVLLTGRLEEAIRRINPKIPESARQEALKEIQRIQSPDLLTNNETFHRYLTEGLNISYYENGNERGD